MDPMCQMLVVPGWFLFRIQSWAKQRVMVDERNDFGICTGGNRFFISMGSPLFDWVIGDSSNGRAEAVSVAMAAASARSTVR